MGIEAKGLTMSYRHAGTTLQRTSSGVTMAVNGLSTVNKLYKVHGTILAGHALAGVRPPLAWGTNNWLLMHIQP